MGAPIRDAALKEGATNSSTGEPVENPAHELLTESRATVFAVDHDILDGAERDGGVDRDCHERQTDQRNSIVGLDHATPIPAWKLYGWLLQSLQDLVAQHIFDV